MTEILAHTTLDEAWKAVKAVLPADARLALQERDGGTYEAWAQSVERTSLGFGYGPTPVEALDALYKHIVNVAAEKAAEFLRSGEASRILERVPEGFRIPADTDWMQDDTLDPLAPKENSRG